MKLWIKPRWLTISWLLAAAVAQNAPSALGQATVVKQSPADAAKKAAYPDETNTGVPADLPLDRATAFTLDVAGATITGLDFQGAVTITAPNVTLRNCRITAEGWAALDIRADGVTVENCEINGQGAPGIRGSVSLATTSPYAIATSLIQKTVSTLRDHQK